MWNEWKRRPTSRSVKRRCTASKFGKCSLTPTLTTSSQFTKSTEPWMKNLNSKEHHDWYYYWRQHWFGFVVIQTVFPLSVSTSLLVSIGVMFQRSHIRPSPQLVVPENADGLNREFRVVSKNSGKTIHLPKNPIFNPLYMLSVSIQTMTRRCLYRTTKSFTITRTVQIAHSSGQHLYG